ncbi:MAG TPA: hypothetical protein DEG43_14870 [Acidimicrobiaceae bacterium]|jgi:hypothetical protein|nr:hypothetical protein [Acidimicrobiaceae bacterium]
MKRNHMKRKALPLLLAVAALVGACAPPSGGGPALSGTVIAYSQNQQQLLCTTTPRKIRIVTDYDPGLYGIGPVVITVPGGVGVPLVETSVEPYPIFKRTHESETTIIGCVYILLPSWSYNEGDRLDWAIYWV